MNPSPSAYIALVLLLPITAMLFTILRPQLATATVLIGSMMFMPERVAFDPPGLPPLDKFSVASICALAACALTNGRLLWRARPGMGLEAVAGIACFAATQTVSYNGDAIIHGPAILPALTPSDAVSMIVEVLLRWVVPFFLGRALCRTGRDLQQLMQLLAIAGLVYVPLILFELRMSPQLHFWVYGTGIWTGMRGGTYRPTCFMENALAVSIFMLTALLASCAAVRCRLKVAGARASFSATTIGAIIVFSKSMAVTVYGIAIAPLILGRRVRLAARVAVLLAFVVAAYPAFRIAGWFPTEQLVELSGRVNAGRAESLQFRFVNEDALVKKALERPWFGWGGWGRNRIYDEYGKDLSVTDGAWIILLGSRGILGWGSYLVLLIGPVFVAARRIKRPGNSTDHALLAALMLMVAVSAVDLLPNGIFSYLPLFLAGCLAGVTSGLRRAPGRVQIQHRRDLVV